MFSNRLSYFVLLLVFFFCRTFALDNGVSRSPPMGWSSWNFFRCDINETLILEVAQSMVSSGMNNVGYSYVNIDDCWMEPRRDRYGNLQADHNKFPHGMKWLADKIHSLGLKLGLYGCPGLKTCLGFPGSYEHEYQDAELFASWGIDYFKYDNCFLHFEIRDLWIDQVYNYSGLNNFTYYLPVEGVPGIGPFVPNVGGDISIYKDPYYESYEIMRDALNATGREIVYSICPISSGCNISTIEYYQNISNVCMNQCPQIDAADNWENFLSHVDSFIQLKAGAFDQPGYFTDLDMLEIGNGGQTESEYRSAMSLYCIFSSPLIAGNDIRNMDTTTQQLLTPAEVIAVNQDIGGLSGNLVQSVDDTQIYAKSLKSDGSVAVALLNRGPQLSNITIYWSELGMDWTDSLVRDLWIQQDLGIFSESFTASVGPHDTVMIKVSSK
eukprot:TRINITY_DN5863_c0_g1_i1.p1 TRINITY_DN5863_c0_g1~~TRINITY_DN5863_c0_g1_i1.p1  ORF type:complete len:439 (-),score=42.06 TRINITY_DN5863_c0_g1_i1:33-1349(-)